MNLYRHIWPSVANGKKTVEGRAWSSKRNYRKMRPGDRIIFTQLGIGRKTTVAIESVHHYKTVREYLTKEGLKKCLPWAKTLAEGIGTYYGIADDWEERICRGGIFAIRMRSL